MFSLKQYHNYDIEWVENLIPFERDIYLEKLLNYISKIKQQQAEDNL